ncbi:hypothetical protein ABZ023_18340 [Streptomyces sp. NPDC006367]|uniref:hypothetical protein n=1 Tax=unclassified Streptomyces TaxID=2593676 RepID=UPI0033A0BE71
MITHAMREKEPDHDFYEWGVYIRLQPEAAERLVLDAGFPVFPEPGWTVTVRYSPPCPACGKGPLYRQWSVERSGVLLAASACGFHTFVVELPAWLRRGGA